MVQLTKFSVTRQIINQAVMSEVEENSKNSDKSKADGTFYQTLRLLALISKFLGAFPLNHVRSMDGRKVKHYWFALIHVWDIAIGVGIIVYFMQSCAILLEQTEHNDVDNTLQIWLTLTCYIVTVRGLIQFILVHFYASLLPDLFSALEEYHQEIGASIIKHNKPTWLIRCLPIARLLVILIIMETTSFFFFDQINGDSVIVDAWPVATSFMFANLWRELPMNFFIFICKYLICRFREIRDEVRKVREKGGKDTSKELEALRLQHAALSRILSLVQSCYGFQLSVNILFLFVDTVLQLFVFFVITSSQNGILLVLAVYFFFMTAALINIVERMERTVSL